ncbi:MAG TPA: hypothetical protein VMU10_12435, partial [Desulfomonilia bacterium]|nr:hypothetical protein [Desulfomonilia bacterium]
ADEANTLKANNRYLINAGVVTDINRNASISFKADNILNDRSREFLDKTSFGTFWYPVSGRTYRLATKITF